MFIKKYLTKESKSAFWQIGKYFLIWRLFLVVVVFLGISLVPFSKGYLGGGDDYLSNPLVWGWANFDGMHYLTIARQGYLEFQQAFFPLYPLLIRYLAVIIRDYLVSGLAVSHLSFLVSLLIFYRLLKLDYKENIAKRSLIYLLLFPTSFFFGSVYSESLFLMLVLGSFYAARKNKWRRAGILGGLASATRFVGIFLLPALLAEWYQSRNKTEKIKPNILIWLGLIASGLFAYMWYLQKTMGDPFLFIHAQPFFGAERTGGKIILLYQVFWRYLKMIFTTKIDVLYFTVWTELLSGILFLVLSVLAYFHLRLSYVIFMVLSYLTPTLTGTFSSMPRYVLVLFPGFILLSVLSDKYRWLKVLYPFFSGFLLIISVILFIRGYWVA